MSFPTTRLRRLRTTEPLRRLVRETHLEPGNFIYPLFVIPGKNIRKEISSMPGIFQLSPDEALREALEARALGIGGIILFGIPEKKDEKASGSYNNHGVVQEAIRAIKRETNDLVVVTDVCLCEYTNHGHCGIVEKKGDTIEIANDATLDVLARVALSHAEAGADIVAPSDMMDGRVRAIRTLLDKEGFHNTAIMSYAAKYASAFYGPFRDAANSSPAFGDRRSHQMDPANSDEALREVALDIEEGADIVMVKPAMPYLDVLRRVKDQFGMPTAAYQVSGEYSMVKAAAMNGWIDGVHSMMESLTSIKRAGADIIITYFAKEAARLLS